MLYHIINKRDSGALLQADRDFMSEGDKPTLYCPTDCPNRISNIKAKYIDKGFSFLSAAAILVVYVVIAATLRERGELIPLPVSFLCMALIGIILAVPTEETAELIGKLLSIRIFGD